MSSSHSSSASVSSSTVNDDSSVTGSDFAGEVFGSVGRYTSYAGNNDSTEQQAPIYIVVLFPPRTASTGPVPQQETENDYQREHEPEQRTEIEEIVLSSDSEADSDDDDSVIYIGTFSKTQRQSDQQDTTEVISEAIHNSDLDELLRDYLQSN